MDMKNENPDVMLMWLKHSHSRWQSKTMPLDKALETAKDMYNKSYWRVTVSGLGDDDFDYVEYNYGFQKSIIIATAMLAVLAILLFWLFSSFRDTTNSMAKSWAEKRGEAFIEYTQLGSDVFVITDRGSYRCFKGDFRLCEFISGGDE